MTAVPSPNHLSALRLASRGWRVFPLHHCVEGRCSCGGRPNCKPGKHPRTRHGLTEATTDQATIDGWWTKWPDANVAVVTDARSGVVALDIDPRNDGDESLRELEAVHGPLPHTIEALTGGGGRHVLFAHPGGYFKCQRGLKPGIDLKGDGGYIVVEPSSHVSGQRYEWELSHHPDETALAPMPDWLIQLARASDSGSDSGSDKADADREDREDREKAEPFVQRSANGSISLSSPISLSSSLLSLLSVLSIRSDDIQRIVSGIESTIPLARGERNDAVFAFARVLKAVPALADADFKTLRPFVQEWHRLAYPHIGTKPFEATWADFIYAFPRVIYPKGDEPMAQIFARAESSAPPACARDYESPEMIRLIKLCRELQRAAGQAPFFLACGMAGDLLGIGHTLAWKLLGVLVTDGVLRVEEPPTTRRATRYRYIADGAGALS